MRSQGWPTPVIIVTGDGDEARATECPAGGAFDILSKPVERFALRAVLRQCLLQSGLHFQEETPAPEAPAPPRRGRRAQFLLQSLQSDSQRRDPHWR